MIFALSSISLLGSVLWVIICTLLVLRSFFMLIFLWFSTGLLHILHLHLLIILQPYSLFYSFWCSLLVVPPVLFLVIHLVIFLFMYCTMSLLISISFFLLVLLLLSFFPLFILLSFQHLLSNELYNTVFFCLLRFIFTDFQKFKNSPYKEKKCEFKNMS